MLVLCSMDGNSNSSWTRFRCHQRLRSLPLPLHATRYFEARDFLAFWQIFRRWWPRSDDRVTIFWQKVHRTLVAWCFLWLYVLPLARRLHFVLSRCALMPSRLTIAPHNLQGTLVFLYRAARDSSVNFDISDVAKSSCDVAESSCDVVESSLYINSK